VACAQLGQVRLCVLLWARHSLTVAVSRARSGPIREVLCLPSSLPPSLPPSIHPSLPPSLPPSLSLSLSLSLVRAHLW
jgi:hypothetical protein